MLALVRLGSDGAGGDEGRPRRSRHEGRRWGQRRGRPGRRARTRCLTNHTAFQTHPKKAQLKGKDGIDGRKGERGSAGERGLVGLPGPPVILCLVESTPFVFQSIWIAGQSGTRWSSCESPLSFYPREVSFLSSWLFLGRDGSAGAPGSPRSHRDAGRAGRAGRDGAARPHRHARPRRRRRQPRSPRTHRPSRTASFLSLTLRRVRDRAVIRARWDRRGPRARLGRRATRAFPASRGRRGRPGPTARRGSPARTARRAPAASRASGTDFPSHRNSRLQAGGLQWAARRGGADGEAGCRGSARLRGQARLARHPRPTRRQGMPIVSEPRMNNLG